MTNIIRDIKTIKIDTDGLTRVDSGPCPNKLFIAIKIHPPEIIPKIPAIIVRKTASKTICLLISNGVAPRARLIPISFVRSFTVISNMFPMAKTPAINVAIPTNQVKKLHSC